jgi:hypothetical protein
MPRLVEAHFSAARQPDLRDRTPPCLFYLGALDTLRGEGTHLGLQVVTHEVQLVRDGSVRGMNRELGRRQREDQPFMACVDPREAEDLTEERPVSRRVLAGDDHMCAEDHRLLIPFVVIERSAR